MNRRTISMLLLASLIALGSIAAGCTDTPGATSADSAPPAGEETPDDPGNVTAGNTRFAFDLYRQIASAPESTGQNLFFSPYSISSALAITYEGARGTTADEIRSVLHLPANDTLRREGFAGTDAGLARGDENCTLHIANARRADHPFGSRHGPLHRKGREARKTHRGGKADRPLPRPRIASRAYKRWRRFAGDGP